MSLVEKFYLAVVVIAFLVFAVTLAWGDAQWRSAAKSRPPERDTRHS